MADFARMGYVRNPYDKCVLNLPSKSNVLSDGVILVEVDDLLEGGTSQHRKNMDTFYKRWKCGKKKTLDDLGDEGTLISGIRVIQHKDFSFSWHMEEYAKSKLSLIEVPRGFMSSTTELN